MKVWRALVLSARAPEWGRDGAAVMATRFRALSNRLNFAPNLLFKQGLDLAPRAPGFIAMGSATGPKDAMISAEEVAKHSTKKDAWFSIHGIVYDITNYLEDHPGGEEVMLDRTGQDATTDFEDVGHSEEARKELEKFQVGKLEGYDPATAKAAAKPAESSSGGSGMMGVLVPVMLVGAAVAYRFLM